MRDYRNLVLLCSIYLTTILLGLNTASFILPLMYPPEGQEQVIQPVVSNPEDPASSIHIFLYILVATAALLFIMKKKWGFIIRGALMLSFFMGILFTTSAFVGDYSLILTILILAYAFWRRSDPNTVNIVLVLTISGVGSVLGASLGFTPALILLLLMSVYDVVAVFVTKHMVKIAEESKGKFALMFLIPLGDRVMGLGAGDLALPLAFTVSVLATHGTGHAIPTAFGGLLGLIALYYYLQSKEKAALPALPPISIGLLIGYLMSAAILGF